MIILMSQSEGIFFSAMMVKKSWVMRDIPASPEAFIISATTHWCRKTILHICAFPTAQMKKNLSDSCPAMIHSDYYIEISIIIRFSNKGDTTEQLFGGIERFSASANEKFENVYGQNFCKSPDASIFQI